MGEVAFLGKWERHGFCYGKRGHGRHRHHGCDRQDPGCHAALKEKEPGMGGVGEGGMGGGMFYFPK